MFPEAQSKFPAGVVSDPLNIQFLIILKFLGEMVGIEYNSRIDIEPACIRIANILITIWFCIQHFC